jgi:hypothetical protein
MTQTVRASNDGMKEIGDGIHVNIMNHQYFKKKTDALI